MSFFIPFHGFLLILNRETPREHGKQIHSGTTIEGNEAATLTYCETMQ